MRRQELTRRPARRICVGRQCRRRRDRRHVTGTSRGLGGVLAGMDIGARRRDRDLRERASRADRAADRGPRSAARRSAPCRSTSWRTRSGRRPRSSPLARELDQRRARAGRAGRARHPGDPRRRPGSSARSRSTSRRSTAPPTPPRARNGSAAPTGPGCCTSTPRSPSACRRPRPSYHRSRTPRRASTRRCAPTAQASTRRSRARRRDVPRRAAAADRQRLRRVLDRAITLAARFADRLADAGHTVAPRDATTLVAFEVPEPEASGCGSPSTAWRAQPARARRTCAPPSAPGTTSPTSTGCSASLAAG